MYSLLYAIMIFTSDKASLPFINTRALYLKENYKLISVSLLFLRNQQKLLKVIYTTYFGAYNVLGLL